MIGAYCSIGTLLRLVQKKNWISENKIKNSPQWSEMVYKISHKIDIKTI